MCVQTGYKYRVLVFEVQSDFECSQIHAKPDSENAETRERSHFGETAKFFSELYILTKEKWTKSFRI